MVLLVTIALLGAIRDNLGTIWLWVRAGLVVVVFALLVYVLYRFRRPIGKLIRERRDRAAQLRAAQDLEEKITSAEKEVRTYYDRHFALIAAEIPRDEFDHDIRRNLRHLKSDHDIADWREEWLAQLKRIVAVSEQNEQQRGPDERTTARQRVRLHFRRHRESFRNREYDGKRFSYEALEGLIERYMSDTAPMAEVVAEGQRLIEIIDKLVMKAEVTDCYEEHRGLISDSEFHVFYRKFLNDQLAPQKRSVADFGQAATRLMQSIREAASEGIPEAVSDYEKQLRDEINHKRPEWTDEQKRQFFARRMKAWKSEQGYKTE